jgi:CRISPR-associated endonuclease Csy4
MDHYMEIRLLPDPEFPVHQLMNALFAKLHRTLVEQGSTDIGVSFPSAGTQAKGMGDRMRMHGSETALRRCMAQDWLKGLRDHAHCSDILTVPEGCSHQTVRRVQALGGSDLRRLRKRLIARTGCSVEEAAEQVPDTAAERLTLPFLTLRSASTGQQFRLFVSQSFASHQHDGEFNTYGFSRSATLPCFG